MDERPQQPPPLPATGTPGLPPELAPPALPDPGSPFLARFALLATILCLGATFVLQQRSAAKPDPTPVAAGVQPPTPDDLGAFVLKVMLKIGHLGTTQGPAGAPPAGSPETEKLLLENIDAAAQAPEERLRAAIVVAELSGAPAASERLRTLKQDLGDPGKFRRWAEVPEADRATLTHDADTLLDLYGSGGSLERPKVDDLASRHGYFGKVAGVWGKPDTDPERTRLLEGVGGIIALFLGLMVFGVGLFLASAACFITAIVLASTGRLRSRFRPAPPGGSVYLETVAVFFAGFLTLKIVHELLELAPALQGRASGIILLCLQWALALVIAWPLVRGVPITKWRLDTGLHTGQGFFKEALCGLGAYLAGLPIVLGALWVTLQLMRLVAGGQDTPKHNAILDGVSQGGIFLVLIFALATLWAPLVEETVFRGSLYRHLRSSLGVVLSAILTALVFGAAHGYQWFALGPVMAIGFNFSIIREWRGSLVGPIVMHALNNATILLIVLSLFSVMKD